MDRRWWSNYEYVDISSCMLIESMGDSDDQVDAADHHHHLCSSANYNPNYYGNIGGITGNGSSPPPPPSPHEEEETSAAGDGLGDQDADDADDACSCSCELIEPSSSSSCYNYHDHDHHPEADQAPATGYYNCVSSSVDHVNSNKKLEVEEKKAGWADSHYLSHHRIYVCSDDDHEGEAVVDQVIGNSRNVSLKRNINISDHDEEYDWEEEEGEESKKILEAAGSAGGQIRRLRMSKKLKGAGCGCGAKYSLGIRRLNNTNIEGRRRRRRDEVINEQDRHFWEACLAS